MAKSNVAMKSRTLEALAEKNDPAMVMRKRTHHALSISFSPEEYVAFVRAPPRFVRVTSATGKLVGFYDGEMLARGKGRSLFARGMREDGSEYAFPIYVLNLSHSARII